MSCVTFTKTHQFAAHKNGTGVTSSTGYLDHICDGLIWGRAIQDVLRNKRIPQFTVTEPAAAGIALASGKLYLDDYDRKKKRQGGDAAEDAEDAELAELSREVRRVVLRLREQLLPIAQPLLEQRVARLRRTRPPPTPSLFFSSSATSFIYTLSILVALPICRA